MVRSLALRLGTGAAAVATAAAAFIGLSGLPGAEAQQGFPPDTPMVAYGDASGSVLGQGVHSMVNNGGVWTYCGSGAVVNKTGGGVGYVVQVAAQSQIAGCGASGRTVKLYFSPASYGQLGKFATQTFNWNGAAGQATAQNVTLGEGLQIRGVVPGIAAKVG